MAAGSLLKSMATSHQWNLQGLGARFVGYPSHERHLKRVAQRGSYETLGLRRASRSAGADHALRRAASARSKAAPKRPRSGPLRSAAVPAQLVRW